MHISILSIAFVTGAVLTGCLHAQPESSDIRPKQHAQQLEALARPVGSYLGVRFNDVNADRAQALKLGEERGIEIKEVEEGSPAERAGIKVGDVILAYNGENVLGAQQFVRLVQETPQGRKVKLQIWRDGRTQLTAVTTGAPPAHTLELPPGFAFFDMPDVRYFTAMDIPNPMLIWKNSMFGIECEPVDSQLAQYFGVKRGILVRSVDKGSSAEKAGMKAGDVLTAVGERSVATPRDLSSYMRTAHPVKTVSVSLMRDHKEVTIQLSIPEKQE